MLVMALASQKGGSGKTTLAGHLAVEAERSGAGPVALIDCDPQGSLSDWWNERASSTPRFARTDRDRLARDIVRRIQDSVDYPGQIRVSVVRETRSVDYAM